MPRYTPGGMTTNAAIILRAVADMHSLSVEEMLSKDRHRRVSWPRQQAMWEIRRHTSLSYPQMAQRLKMGHHTTIIHGVAEHQKRVDAGEAKPLDGEALGLRTSRARVYDDLLRASTNADVGRIFFNNRDMILASFNRFVSE